MLAELYTCDREGCKNTTKATGRGAFFYNDAGWLGVKTVRTGQENPLDFCSLECLAMWVDSEIEKKRKGG